MARIIATALILLAAAALTAHYAGLWSIPERWNPRAPLRIDAEPNFLTRYKLARLSSDPASCLQVLAQSPFEFEAVEDRVTGPACGLFDAVRIDRTSAALTESFSLTCRAAVSLALWERHVLQPAAHRHFEQPVATLEHFGSYACRNIYGRPNATRSQHATAEALDVAGFVLADGRRVRVLNDWDANTAAGAFLQEIHGGACRFFDAVLGPGYNAAHRDHLHLDRGRFTACR